MVEVWTHGTASQRGIRRFAAELEVNGWDGLSVVDSQNLSGDPYVALTMAALDTEKIRLGTAVTNSVTRMSAVTATAIASVDRISDGRALLGIGRGDSALSHLGLAPARLSQFENYLIQRQKYLRGEAVKFDEIKIPTTMAPSLLDLELADKPTESRIGWLGGRNKVPLEVAASGPKVIEIAALNSDRVMFTLGADVSRIAWGIELAKKARRRAGLDPDGIKFGSYVNCVCCSDTELARDLVRGGLATFARFSIMHGKAIGPISIEAETALKSLHKTYDMRKHTEDDSRQASSMSAEFIEQFAIAGPPEYCIGRLRVLIDLGLDKCFFGLMFRLMQSPEGVDAKAFLEQEVSPKIRTNK